MKINVKGSSESVRFTIETAEPSWTVGQLKAQCEAQCGVAAASQRLIFSGHVLKDMSTLESYSAYFAALCSKFVHRREGRHHSLTRQPFKRRYK